MGILPKTLSKFKNYLKKQKIDLINQNILIPHTNHAAFTAMLHLLKELLKDCTPNDQTHQIYCLYINENFNDEKRYKQEKDNLKVLMHQAQMFNIIICSISLLDYFFDTEPQIRVLQCFKEISDQGQKKFEMFLGRLADATTRQYLSRELHDMLIIYAAKKLQCDTILLDDSALDSAVHVMSNVTLGRGISSHVMSSFAKQNTNIKVFFPLEIYTQQEIILYLESCGWNYKCDWISFCHLDSSIQNMTKKFIINLDNNDLVLSNVCKLSRKVFFIDSNLFLANHCILCHKLLRSFLTQKIETEFTRNFSDLISKVGKLSRNSQDLFIEKSMDKFHLYSSFTNTLQISAFQNEKNYKFMRFLISNIDNICGTCIIFFYSI